MIRSPLAAKRADRAITRALESYADRDVPGATAILQAALRRDPDNPELIIELAGVIESDEQAVELAVRAAELAPSDALIAMRVGRVHMVVGLLDEAEAWFDRAEELDVVGSPLRPNCLMLRGNLAGYRGDWHRARQLLYAAFEARPEGAERGDALVGLSIDAGDHGAAEEALSLAIRHNPEDERLASWRAFLDRGAPRCVWTAELRLSVAGGSALHEHAATDHWRAGHRASEETEFREAVVDALSALQATVLGFDDVTCHLVSPHELVSGRFSEVPLNDVVFVPSMPEPADSPRRSGA